MGRAYAIAQGETPERGRRHPRPLQARRRAGRRRAGRRVRGIVALADRFDTLAGCFAVGLAPTGAADPFALRRACIGALRTLLDRGYALPFSALVCLAYDGLEGKKLDLSRVETVAKIEEFATERLRGLVASATSTPGRRRGARRGRRRRRSRTSWRSSARARALQAVVDAKEPWLEKAQAPSPSASRASAARRSPCCTPAAEFAASAKKDDVVIAEARPRPRRDGAWA